MFCLDSCLRLVMNLFDPVLAVRSLSMSVRVGGMLQLLGLGNLVRI